MVEVPKSEGPRRLVEWPWVIVEVECSLCRKHGRYRLARLAERFGAEVDLMAMLRALAARCGLNKPGVKPRQYEAQCGARYLVPAGGPLPAGAPGRERAEGERPQRRKRLGPDGPPPTVAQVRRQGISTVSVTCLGLWRGSTCYGTTTLPLDRLGASDDTVFLDLCRLLRLVCSRCGGRKMHIVPVWPDVRQARAASLGVDTRPAMPGTRPGYRMPGLGDVPPA